MSGSERFIVCDANGRFGCVDTELKKTAWAGTDKRLAEVIREESANGMAGSWAWVNEMPVESPSVETTEPSKSDQINPPHYKQHPSGVECIQIAEHLNFCIGNAIKYLWRAGLKGDALTDLRKAKWYVEREIQRVEKMKGGGA